MEVPDLERLRTHGPTLQQWVDRFGGVAPAARAAGVTRERMRHWCDRLGVKSPARPGQHSTYVLAERAQSDAPPTVQERVAEARRKAEEQAAQRELRDLVNRRAQIEAIRDAIRDAGLQADIPPLRSDLPLGGPFDEEEVVLVLSDWHIGTMVEPTVNAGYAVTIETARRQVEQLIRVLSRLWDIQHRVTPWRRLTILGLGDWVEGALRPAQHREALPVAQQAVAAGIALAVVIREALRIFEQVRFEAVPGNHGRVSQKPGVGGLDQVAPINSWDWIAVEYARGILGGLDEDQWRAHDAPRLEIRNHASYMAVTEVAGHRIVFEHGAAIKGGAYGGVPWYPVDRAAKNAASLIAPVDLEWDDETTQFLRRVGDYYLFVLGHFHRPAILPQSWGWVVANDSLPPTTPFVAATQHQALMPVQWLLSLHPRKGVTHWRPIYLQLPEWRGLRPYRPAPPRFGEEVS